MRRSITLVSLAACAAPLEAAPEAEPTPRVVLEQDVIVVTQRGVGPLLATKRFDLEAARVRFAPRPVSRKLGDVTIGATIEARYGDEGELYEIVSRDRWVRTARGIGPGSTWDKVEATEGKLACHGGPVEGDTTVTCWHDHIGFRFEVATDHKGGGADVRADEREVMLGGRKVVALVWRSHVPPDHDAMIEMGP